MFSLSICISSSEHHHWIHASNSLCSFLAGEYASAAPPDSSIIDSDAVAFRTMRHQLALERGEIDYESEGDYFNSFCDFTGSEGDIFNSFCDFTGSEGDFFKSFCDFNDDPEVPELEEFTDEDEPEMEDLSLRDRSPDHSTRHSLLRSLLTTTLTQWLRAPTVMSKQRRPSANIAACVNNWITNFSAHTALAGRTTVKAFRMVNFRFANDRSAHSAVINERNIQLLRTHRSVNPDLLERKAPNLLFIPSIVTLLQDSAPFCLLKRRRIQQHRSYLRSLMLEWMSHVADASIRTAIFIGLLYEQYNAHLADLLQSWRLHLPYYPNHAMFIEFRCMQFRRAMHTCHNAYLSTLLQLWLQRARALPDISPLTLDNDDAPCNDVPLRSRRDTDDDDDSRCLREITHTLLQLSQTNREFLAHASFIDWGDSAADAPCSKWKQICSIWDSASNTCLINPNLIRSHWKWASRDKRLVTGVGGKQTECYGIVIVPIMSTFAGEILFVCSTVVNFHPIIDFMYGLDFQESHRAIFDPSNYRVYLGALKETIRLDKLRKVRARLNAEPIGMVSICGGCDPPLGMALMMGFKVCFYLSIEKYEHTRSVAKGIYPQIIHVEPHDLMEIDISRLSQRIIDLKVSKVVLTSGCPCTPWSRLSPSPLGFDHPLAQLVTRTAELIGLLKSAGILWKVMNETVVPHENLYKDIVRLEQLMGMPYLMHNALSSGAVASRPRLLGLIGATVAGMPKATHLNPDMVLQTGWHFARRPVRCLVAVGDSTRSPVIVVNHQGTERFIDADERDRINPGSRAGLSTGYGAIDLSLKQRQRITGNAFSNDMLWAVMYQWTLDPPALHTVMVSAIASPYWEMTAQQAEAALSVLTVPEIFAKFSSMVKPDFMPRIPILVKEGHDILPFQTRAPGVVPPKLQISADYKVEQMIRSGTHKRIPYSKDIWIMLMFFKPKLRSEIAEFDGPNWKTGDLLEALRPLVDYRASNAAQYYHPWLIEWSPNNKLNIASIPPNTTHWADHDSKDAYHAMLIQEAGKRMGCAKYVDSQGQTVYLEPQCCQQGQASSAAWFSPWVRYGYNCFIGPHHAVWWMDFSDDSCAHGCGETQCLTRYSILGIIKVLMGMKPQLKRSPSCSVEKQWAGLVWTIKGVCISETARLAIIEACSIIPRGVTQMRRLRGQIQSGLLGFDMTAGSMSAFVKLMIPINDAITEAESTGKFSWPQAARDSQEAIITKMNNTPKSYTHPDRILDESHSLFQLGDGDPRAVCSGIISVPVADASDITLDMIHSLDSGAVLICIYFQTLNKHQTRWMMYEIESFAHVVCHR